MRRSLPLLCILPLLALAIGAPPEGRGAEKGIKVGVTEAVFPGATTKELLDAVGPFRSLLESSTGLSGDPVLVRNSHELADRLKNNKAQLGVFTGVEFAWAKERNPKLEPLVILVNEKRTVTALVVVRKAAKLKEPADLRGKTLSQLPVKEVRSHVKLLLDRKVVGEDSTPKKFFKQVKEVEDVENALDDVKDGQADAAVVDGLAWDSYRKSKPGTAAHLRVLLSSDRMPPPVLACQAGHYSAAEVKRLRGGLVRAKNSSNGKKLLQQLRLTGFEAVPDDFDKQLAAAAKAFPPPKAK